MEIFDKTTCREYWEINTFNDNPFHISISFSLLKEDEAQKYHFTFYNKKITYPLLWEAYRKTL